MYPLRIVPFSVDRADIVSWIYQGLRSTFDVIIENLPVDYDSTFNQERNQYNSTALIHCLLNHYPDKGAKVLGVTSLDLHIPILTFVFGEAQLDGTVAVVSSYRLKPEFYGLPHDDALLAERLVKESFHELGHTFGLVHCPYYECVMHSSTYVEEIDLKRPAFCPECQKTFEKKNDQPPYYSPAAANE